MAEAATMAKTPTRIRVIICQPPPARAATPGMAAAPIQRRTVFMASVSIAAGWRRCTSELIVLPGQLGDPVAHLSGDGGGELGDLVRARRRVEDDRREAEAPLERTALAIGRASCRD